MEQLIKFYLYNILVKLTKNNKVLVTKDFLKEKLIFFMIKRKIKLIIIIIKMLINFIKWKILKLIKKLRYLVCCIKFMLKKLFYLKEIKLSGILNFVNMSIFISIHLSQINVHFLKLFFLFY